jgi:hypothetical protein
MTGELPAAAGQDELQRVQRRDGMRLLRAAADSMLLRDNLNDAIRYAFRYCNANHNCDMMGRATLPVCRYLLRLDSQPGACPAVA